MDDLSAAERQSLLRNEPRPAIKPFKGNKLFLRFATQGRLPVPDVATQKPVGLGSWPPLGFVCLFADDKKELGAARRSRYYMKYGNPNYGGMKGILTNSW